MSKLDKTIINNIKCLGLDMIQNAGSGHPGIILGSTEILYSLYAEELNYKRNIPNWINRDRFVLSNGHGSAMLYSLLYLSGFALNLEDLKDFRKLNSKTPGHPEYDKTPGIECSTGPLGEGISTAVGMAFAERYYESLINSIIPKNKLINYYTYCFCGDGDLMEGISYESLSFAGTQKLNKLILIYDNNKTTLDANTNNVFNEDIEMRFEAINFNVLHIKNNGNIDKICEAIEVCKKSKKPSLIIVDTIIGKGLSFEGTNKTHGGMLTNDELIKYKTKLNYSLEPFYVDEKAKELYIRNIDERTNSVYKKWLIEYEKTRNLNNTKVNDILDLLENDNFKVDFDSANFKINDDYFEELRLSNNKMINIIANKNPYILFGSADLSNSCKTNITSSKMNTPTTPLEKNIYFGVRENAMGGIMNGMALSNLRPVGSTFLAFSDYLRPSIRQSAIMNLPVTYIFTHDSIANSYDGPTHEPVEQLNNLREIPNLYVIRPCDINEVIGSWEFILKNRVPVALSLSKNKTFKFKYTNAKYVKYGAYMIRKEKIRLDGIIISSGIDMDLTMKIANEMFDEGFDFRVVSMPCMELFLQQNPKYEEQLLPKDVKTFIIESSSSLIWNRFASNNNCIFGINKFGKSGNPDELAKEYGFDSETIKRKIKENL